MTRGEGGRLLLPSAGLPPAVLPSVSLAHTCMVAVARASTGLTTHRPASARVRAWCHRSRDPSAGRAREPVCESHDSTGEPGAGDRPAGFGERGEETCSRESDCGPVAKAPDEPPIPIGYAPPLDSTGTVVNVYRGLLRHNSDTTARCSATNARPTSGRLSRYTT